MQADDDTLAVWKVLNGLADEKRFLIGFLSTHHMPRALESFEMIHIFIQGMIRIPSNNPKAHTRPLMIEITLQDFLSRQRFLGKKKLTDSSISCPELELSVSTLYQFKSFACPAPLQKLNRSYIAGGIHTDNINSITRDITTYGFHSTLGSGSSRLYKKRSDQYSYLRQFHPSDSAREELDGITEINRMLAAEVKIGFKREREEIIDEVYKKELGEFIVENEDWGESFRTRKPRQNEREIVGEEKEEVRDGEMEDNAEDVAEFDNGFFEGMNFDTKNTGGEEYESNPLPANIFQFESSESETSYTGGFSFEAKNKKKDEDFFFEPPQENGVHVEFDFNRKKSNSQKNHVQNSNEFDNINHFPEPKKPINFLDDEEDFFIDENQDEGLMQNYPSFEAFQPEKNQNGQIKNNQDEEYSNTQGNNIQNQVQVLVEERPIDFSQFGAYTTTNDNQVDENAFFGNDDNSFFEEKKPALAHENPRRVDTYNPVTPSIRIFDDNPTQPYQQKPIIPPLPVRISPSRQANPFAEETSTPRNRDDSFDIPKPKEFFDSHQSDSDSFFRKPMVKQNALDLDLLGLDIVSPPHNPTKTHHPTLIPLDSLIEPSFLVGEPRNPFEDDSPTDHPTYTPTQPIPPPLPPIQKPAQFYLPQDISFIRLHHKEYLSYIESKVGSASTSKLTLSGMITPVSTMGDTSVKMSLLGEVWGNSKQVEVKKGPVSTKWIKTGETGVEYSLRETVLRKDKLPSLIKHQMKNEKQVTLKLYTNLLYAKQSMSGASVLIRVSKQLNKFQFEASKQHNEIRGNGIYWKVGASYIARLSEIRRTLRLEFRSQRVFGPNRKCGVQLGTADGVRREHEGDGGRCVSLATDGVPRVQCGEGDRQVDGIQVFDNVLIIIRSINDMFETDVHLSTKPFEELELINRKDLGKGGYASVKLGRLKGSSRLYAVKIVGGV